MKNKIYFLLFLIAINYPSGTYAATIAFSTQRYAMVQDTIVIEEVEALRAYQKAVSFYDSIAYYVLLILALNFLSVLLLVLHARADRNIEKAMIFYKAVGDAEKIEVLKRLQERSDKVLPLYMLSFYLRSFFLLIIMFGSAIFFPFPNLFFIKLFALFFIAYFFLFDALIFRIKSKTASKSDNNLTIRELLGMK